MRAISALLLSACLSVLTGTATAQDFYVSPNGDDGGAGTESRPWQTLAKAAATVTAGASVFIMEGVYHERLLPENSGSAGMHISYTAYPGDSAIIDGAGISVPRYSALVDLAGRQYIRISGLRVMNSNEAGILADGSSEIIIEGNSITNTGSSGIGVWSSSNVRVSGNMVEQACTSGDQECISVAGTDAFVVTDNVVFDCRKEGICLKDGSSDGEAFLNHVHHSDHVGIYVDAWDKHTLNIDVHRNLVHEVALKSGIMLASEQGGQLENVRVFNNVSYANGFDGISISDCCPGVDHHPIRNVVIVNNTFTGNGISGWGGGIGVQNNPDLEGIIIRNNICSQNLSFQIAVDAAALQSVVFVDHNLIDGFRGEESEVRGIDFVEADPLFENAGLSDYHLLGGSPAIDAGSPLEAPAQDYDGRARPSGAGMDIGAFERESTTPVEELRAYTADGIQLDQNYPNPFSESTVIPLQIARVAAVTLKVYDILGREVLDLSESVQGAQRVRIHASRFPAAGVYVYQLGMGDEMRMRTMLVVR